ncbi:DUF721 domain-containing protein [Terrihabitans sp. B22-R8]|uniref:DUF721 domain-containing protein n=1 Tax=Terrihabitans sp. B22-R8 TaxID=3425128 RepID=UPI00403D3074
MSSAPKSRPNARSLAHFVPKVVGDTFAKQGFAGGEIVLRWAEIAGPDLARRSRPLKLTFPRRKAEEGAREPAVLLIQVEGAFALELQMQGPALIERINRYFGWRCVGSLKLKQGPVDIRPAAIPAEPKVDPSQEKRLEDLVGGIEDDRLAEALKRLGRAVSHAQWR